MWILLISLLLLSFQLSSYAQILEFDQLDMRYHLKDYKSLLRKAHRLLHDPVYDVSFVPRYYSARAKLQLAQDDKWRRRNKYAIEEAQQTFKELKQTHE